MNGPGTSAPRGELYRPVVRRRLPYWPGWTVLIVLALIGGLAAGAVLVLRSGYLDVKSVEVTGTRRLDPGAIRAAVDLESRSMFDIDESRIEDTLLQEPLLARVDVWRKWPHTVSIAVDEREPWGFWQVGGRVYVIDREGVVIHGEEPRANAPFIVQVDAAEALAVGDRVDASAVRLVEELLKVEFRRPDQVPAAFDWSAKRGLVVETVSGLRVVLGDAQDLDAKLALWDALLVDARRYGISVRELDLRFGDSPAIRGRIG